MSEKKDRLKRIPKFADSRIKIWVEGIGLSIVITSIDPCNLLLLAANTTECLKSNDMEPTVEFQP